MRRAAYLALLAGAACTPAPPVPYGAVDVRDAGTAAAPVDAGHAIDAGVTIPVRDAGRPPSALPDQCDPVRQTGCDGVESRCIVENPEGKGAICTLPRMVEPGLGEPCAGGDCQAGLACVLGDAGDRVCETLCDLYTGEGCTNPETECLEPLADTNWGICTPLAPACDPLTQQPCATAEACQPMRRLDATWELRCGSAGATTEGAACERPTDCGRGLTCIIEDSSAACRRLCGSDQDCSGGTACDGRVVAPPLSYCSEE